MNGTMTYHRCGSVEVGDLLLTKFFSWSGQAITDTPAGMLTEMERLGAAVNLTDGLGQSPLRQLQPLTRLLRADDPMLVSVALNVYDVTLTGSAEQDATTLAAMTATVDPSDAGFSPNDGYMQSRFRNSVVGGWQPNFVRPRIRVNNKSILFDDFEAPSEGYPGADHLFGLDVPWCAEVNYRIGQRIQHIECFCPAGQIVGSKIQRFAVSLELLWDITDQDERETKR